MNKELQDRLIEYLGSLDGAVRQAGGFVAEQAPLVAQEWLAWQFWCCVAGVVVFWLGAIACAVFARLCYTKFKTDRHGSTDWFAGVVALSFLTVFLCGFSLISAGGAVKTKIAPRVVILEKIAELANQAK